MRWSEDQLSPQIARRVQELAPRYKPTEWLWALNLGARNDPRKLQITARILSEMLPVWIGHSADCKRGTD